jgi:hypothetical protein
VQHSILRQQRGTHIQQFIEELDVWNPRVLGYQKYKLDRPLTQALAELPHEWGFLANAFVNDHPFDAVHERTRGSLRRRSVVQRTTLAVKLHRCLRRYDTASLAAFTGRALMIFRAGFALNIVGSFVHVSASDKHLPVASGGLRDSYRHQSNPDAQAITECLCGFLFAHQLKQFRTKRRRIRAHFGSPDNIVATALTIGQRRTAQGMVGGYVLKLDARHGIKSLFPASESYFLDRAGNEPLQAMCWALVHVFQLQLQNYPITLYHIDGAALARCTALIDDRDAAATAIERMAARLLAALSRPNAAECSKGRFFDRASDKLNQLARLATNELVSVNLQAVAAALSSHG